MPNDIAIQQETAVMPISDSAQMIDLIGRLASDPNSNIDKMERLMAMRRDMEQQAAKVSFNQALSVMQTAIPAIKERGKGHNSTYAKWEDINKVIKPIMSEHGFALRFSVDTKDKVSVTATLSHKLGYEVSTTMVGNADKSGSKNDIQAIGSSVSYLKRYTASALLNITSHGEGDDGFGSETSQVLQSYKERMKQAKTTDDMTAIRADIMTDNALNSSDKKEAGKIWVAKNNTFGGDNA